MNQVAKGQQKSRDRAKTKAKQPATATATAARVANSPQNDDIPVAILQKSLSSSGRLAELSSNSGKATVSVFDTFPAPKRKPAKEQRIKSIVKAKAKKAAFARAYGQVDSHTNAQSETSDSLVSVRAKDEAFEDNQKRYHELRYRQRMSKAAVASSWRCPFPLTMPKQSPRAVRMKEGVLLYPFQFGFQQHRMPRELRQALYDWSIIWPVQAKSRLDNKRGYIFEDEGSYYKEYGTSVFAYTYRKGGWESMRHYEIMCNGAIPYFIDIEKMPPHTMTRFPKEIVAGVMKLPGIDPVAGTLDHKKINMPCLYDVRKVLLDYCRQNMTTVALAKYFLSAMGQPSARRILMINGRQQWEYMTDSLTHGLRLLLGSGFVDYEKRLFLYRGMREKALANGFTEYGRGFSYAYALPDDPNVERDPETVRRQIRTRYYDIIIIGQLFQPRPTTAKSDWETSTDLNEQLLWDEVSKFYSRDEIALLDGLDYHKVMSFIYIDINRII